MNESNQHKIAARRSRLSRTLIRDIAQEANVSIATVSRALNGKLDVSSATREKVLHIAQQNGYVVARRANTPAGRRLVGFTVPEMSSMHFMEIMQGAAEVVDAHEASLLVCSTAYRSEREKSLLERLLQSDVEGVLLIFPSESAAELQHLQQRGFPFVVVDPTYPVAEHVLVVATANMAGGRRASEYLLTLGHRRIGAITGPASLSTTVDRLAGYHAALNSAGLAVDPALVVESDFSVEGGQQAARRLLGLAEPPSAIFAFNDMMAVGTLRAAEERGLRVPEDLSLIGFDDVAFATYTTPALTTIHQPTRELGRAGAGLLFRRLQGQAIEAQRIELSTRLIVRASTGPAPARGPGRL